MVVEHLQTADWDDFSLRNQSQEEFPLNAPTDNLFLPFLFSITPLLQGAQRVSRILFYFTDCSTPGAVGTSDLN